jgi:hypothetical protein
MAKTSQLQLRVTPAQKAAIKRDARAARMNVSEWILAQVLKPARGEFERLTAELARAGEPASHALAALNDFLVSLSPRDATDALSVPPPHSLSPLHRAYLAAMVELTALRNRQPVPAWTRDVPALTVPYFASDLLGLRAHLLRASPPPFRSRNLFIDASLGDRV